MKCDIKNRKKAYYSILQRFREHRVTVKEKPDYFVT
jgi:hypothetical protein